MKEKKKKILQNNRGITGIDLAVSLIVATIFIGLLTGLMTNIYKTSLEIQKSANAMAYATIILEKVDEKAYEQVTEDFITTLGDEVSLDTTNYQFSLSVIPIKELEDDIIKKVELRVRYTINGEEKTMIISKLKIREL